MRPSAWRRVLSGLARAQERSFAGAAATAPAHGIDNSLPEVSDNHKGPVGVLQVTLPYCKALRAATCLDYVLPSQRQMNSEHCPFRTFAKSSASNPMYLKQSLQQRRHDRRIRQLEGMP